MQNKMTYYHFFKEKTKKKVPFLRFKLIFLINVLLSFDSFLFSLEHTKTLYHTLTRCSLF